MSLTYRWRMINTHRRPRRRLSRLGLPSALALICACAVAAPAAASHWVSENQIWSALVQGESNSDHSYFGRVDSPWSGYTNYCGVGDTNRGWYGFGYTTGWSLCSLWSASFGGTMNECRGVGYAHVPGRLGERVRPAHNYGGWCPVTLHPA